MVENILLVYCNEASDLPVAGSLHEVNIGPCGFINVVLVHFGCGSSALPSEPSG